MLVAIQLINFPIHDRVLTCSLKPLSSHSYGSANYIKYIHTFIVSEPNNVCEELEGESECWKRKKKQEGQT